ncbi:MAG: NADP-dependent oxidoreductase [Burkholderiaceae bacterium]|nr:NADP-dependent oxidoreductase [Burkholderiaceae bacterium]
MRALRYDRFGPVREVAHWVEVDDPVPGPRQVRVRVAWASINPLDWKLVEGQFRWFAKSRPPCGIGAEFSGVVDALGPAVKEPAVGSRVLGFINPFVQPPGALQTHVLLPADDVFVAPPSLALDGLATVPVAGMSALQMCRLAEVRAGQRVLVHGAAGGVGSFAVQVVGAFGATAVATGSAASQALIATLGSQAQFDYRTQPPSAWGGPFDAVLDCATALAPADIVTLLANGGHYVSTLPRFPWVVLDPLLNRFRRTRRHALQLAPTRADLQTLLDWVAEDRVQPRITAHFEAAAAVQALAQSKAGQARGKLVVRLGDAT